VLIAVGASVVGTIEGWYAVEAIFWALVTLTTIGYGTPALTEVSSKVSVVMAPL